MHYTRVRIIYKPKFHLAHLVLTRHVRRVEPMHFGCVELVEQHGSTRHARHVELDWLDTFDMTSAKGATCSFVVYFV